MPAPHAVHLSPCRGMEKGGEIMIKEKEKSIAKRTTRPSHRDDCPLCKEYLVPNEVTRKAIFETSGSLTFADAKSAFAFLMEQG